MQSIKVRHNVEMAHRLSLLPGKCEQIHGHSWWIELEIFGPVEENGILLEFGPVKAKFREYLDNWYDHRLLLNKKDKLIQNVLPGVIKVNGDPTTENIARWIGRWAQDTFSPIQGVKVTVWETSVNCATWEVRIA